MAYSGATAAIATAVGVSTTMVSLITTVAFSVTGISAKINEAAADVFGEDLVKVANIAGGAYSAFSGGFADAGGAEGMTDGAFLGESAWSPTEGASAMDFSGAGGDVAASAGDVFNLSDGAQDLASQADGIRSMNGDAGEFMKAAAPATNQATELGKLAADPNRIDTLNIMAKPEASAPVQQQPVNAASQQAAAPQQLRTEATANVKAPQAPPAAQRSFFDKLVFDKDGNVSSNAMRLGGQVLSGVGQGYVAGQKAKEDRRQFDIKQGMYDQRPGLRLTR